MIEIIEGDILNRINIIGYINFILEKDINLIKQVILLDYSTSEFLIKYKDDIIRYYNNMNINDIKDYDANIENILALIYKDVAKDVYYKYFN